jgi:acyl-CoA synthetase (AMP-forming)/AMP-acid ligase II
MNLIDYFDHGAAHYPQRDCLNDGLQSLSYRDVQTLTHAVALALQAADINECSKVGNYSPNHIHAFAASLGIYRAGAVMVPVNAKAALEENAYILNNTDIECLFYHACFYEQVLELRQRVPSLRLCICIDQPQGDDPGLMSWCQPYQGRNAPPLDENPDRIAILGATGGTTGYPKAVCATNQSFETMVSCFLACMPCEVPPVHLVVAPLTHAAGAFALPLFTQGATQILMADVDPESIMHMIEQHKVTHLFLPPTVIYMMLAHPKVRDYDYSSLKYFLYCAAPMSADKLKQAIEVFGPVMVQSFGQAEAPMTCTFMSAQDHIDALKPGNEHRLLSCGKATPFVRLAIMDDEGNLQARNSDGEIVIRSSLVMAGYYNNAKATEESQAYGWHHTGDIGRIDDDGFVYIVDRKKDMIISGGFNVFPSEIEQVIWSHPAVQDCAVIGVPDNKWGEAVKAVIEAVPGQTVNEQAIIALCKEKLGSVKAPKTVEVWDKLPRSPVGKVLKKTIRKTFWEGYERAI